MVSDHVHKLTVGNCCFSFMLPEEKKKRNYDIYYAKRLFWIMHFSSSLTEHTVKARNGMLYAHTSRELISSSDYVKCRLHSL
jgi:hypothetical protein